MPLRESAIDWCFEARIEIKSVGGFDPASSENCLKLRLLAKSGQSYFRTVLKLAEAGAFAGCENVAQCQPCSGGAQPLDVECGDGFKNIKLALSIHFTFIPYSLRVSPFLGMSFLCYAF